MYYWFIMLYFSILYWVLRHFKRIWSNGFGQTDLVKWIWRIVPVRGVAADEADMASDSGLKRSDNGLKRMSTGKPSASPGAPAPAATESGDFQRLRQHQRRRETIPLKRTMAPFISIIIPNRNGETTIGLCLEAAFGSKYEPFEVIVVDDDSEDKSIEVIERFPCKLVRLDRHGGASTARNAGAAHSRGEVLFFTDADCLLEEDSLAVAAGSFASYGPSVVIGGTYTQRPYDQGFFSHFQSIFINYSECKNADHADYAASHAMVIASETFRRNQGFPEGFLPVAEDVEFSHRLRRAGCRIVVNPRLQVRHIFDFSLQRSLRNAGFKSMNWTIYSIENRDVFADSGTASIELKANVVFCFANIVLLLLYIVYNDFLLLYLMALPIAGSLSLSRGLIMAFFKGGGVVFGVAAVAYYLFLYPLAVGAGGFAGVVRYLVFGHRQRKGG